MVYILKEIITIYKIVFMNIIYYIKDSNTLNCFLNVNISKSHLKKKKNT